MDRKGESQTLVQQSELRLYTDHPLKPGFSKLSEPLVFNNLETDFLPIPKNNKKRSHTQLDSRKQVIAFQDRVITINIKEAQHPLKREKQVIDKSSIMLKISTKSMHRVLV